MTSYSDNARRQLYKLLAPPAKKTWKSHGQDPLDLPQPQSDSQKKAGDGILRTSKSPKPEESHAQEKPETACLYPKPPAARGKLTEMAEQQRRLAEEQVRFAEQLLRLAEDQRDVAEQVEAEAERIEFEAERIEFEAKQKEREERRTERRVRWADTAPQNVDSHRCCGAVTAELSRLLIAHLEQFKDIEREKEMIASLQAKLSAQEVELRRAAGDVEGRDRREREDDNFHNA